MITNSYVSWGAVLAGAAIATAVSLVLLQFGGAVGLASVTDMGPQTLVSAGDVITIAVWLLWVQLMASALGGYVAGRLRQPIENASEHESEVRDGLHGALVWATGTIAVAAAAATIAAIAALMPESTPVIVDTPEVAANEKTAAVLYAFAAGSTSLVSAVVAWYAAAKGGDHRDRNTDLTQFLSFRIR